MDQPQLRMRFTRFDDLAAIRLPAGFSLRTYQPGDERVWVDLLNRNAQLGEWSLERQEKTWQNGERIPPDGLFFIVCEGKAVATACVTLHPLTTDPFELGWVAVDPDYQGRRLATPVCLAVLHNLRERGCQRAYLLTEDHRLPAIRTYLNLGFTPELTDPSHPERWRVIDERLAAFAQGTTER